VDGAEAGRVEGEVIRCLRLLNLTVSSTVSYLIQDHSLRPEDRRGKVLTVGWGERRRGSGFSLAGLQAVPRGPTMKF
jgi:hypothetical protein